MSTARAPAKSNRIIRMIVTKMLPDKPWVGSSINIFIAWLLNSVGLHFKYSENRLLAIDKTEKNKIFMIAIAPLLFNNALLKITQITMNKQYKL